MPLICANPADSSLITARLDLDRLPIRLTGPMTQTRAEGGVTLDARIGGPTGNAYLR